MTYDPRSAMIRDGHYPWLDGEKAEPRIDAPLSDRGPLERERKIITVNIATSWWRLREWLGR